MKTNESGTHRMKNEAPLKKAGLSAKDPPACDHFFSSGFHKKYHLLKK
jgi:hypothetical protein